MKKRLFLKWHLGLGDALICNGLVRNLLETQAHEIVLPSWPHNAPTVRAMFSDLESVSVVEIISAGELILAAKNYEHVLPLGYYGENFNEAQWDVSFYQQAGVGFLEKWGRFECPEPRSSRAVEPVFIHDDIERGYCIPMEGRRPLPRASLFDFIEDLRGAREIHCINSCFAILADLITGCPAKKFLHVYARPGEALPVFGEHWTYLRKPC